MACIPNVPDANGNICCSPLDRRSFLRRVGAGTIVGLSSSLPALADPLDNPNFDPNMPADKGLKPEWLKALSQRGWPEVYTGKELDQINMPIGGICAGQVNLDGNGRLVNWRVIETPKEIEQGFVLKLVAGGRTEIHPLTHDEFPGMSFRGEYPIAKIEYNNASLPVQTSLEVFSPFSPLDEENSGLPATIFHFTLKNTSPVAVEATLAGGLENGFCIYNQGGIPAKHRNQITHEDGVTVLNCSGSFNDVQAPANPRPDAVFENWDKPTYEGWTIDGNAFGTGPLPRATVEGQMGQIGGESPGLVNSYISGKGDQAMGTLTSAPFAIAHNYINFWLGGGDQEGKVGINLLIDGKVVQTQAGARENKLTLHFFDVRDFQGKQATLQIFDHSADGWAQVGVGRITFSDVAGSGIKHDKLGDDGSTALGLLGAPAELTMAQGSVGFDGTPGNDITLPLNQKLTGTLGRTVTLDPGASADVTFIVAWHYPNLSLDRLGEVGRFYGTKHDSAAAVVKYIAANFDKLAGQTRLWRDTWYDSTLPYWFLDRTFANASTLATSTAFRFSNGRFYGWEGVGNCTGTCTHVWSYEQTMGRLFPELDRALMEQACFNPGVALHPDGQINFRDETMGIAVDGQAGTILRAYRLHQMSADGEFLRKNWPRIRLAVAWLMEQDTDGDGILDRNQSNTLDAEWYGKIAWLSGLYIAALRAAEEMAVDRKDAAFAASCHARVEAGRKNIVGQLWNGRYFIQTVDPKHEGVVGSYAGCEIDQVFGQSWAFQAGLGRILPEAETREALRSLWRYNFATDVGPYRAVHKDGRWFAMPGEAGLLMCTQPDGTDRDFKDPPGSWTQVYLNECMNGFEHQAAGHMIWEGLVLEGLAVERAVHDRYDAAKRNPWNEIECGNHYARSMASFGVFLAACGYEYHGPKGSLGFAPRIHPEDFRAAFVTAEGWGSFSQKIDAAGHAAAVELKRGSLSLRTLALATSRAVATVEVRLNGGVIPAGHRLDGGRLVLEFPTDMRLVAGDRLSMFAT